MKKYINKLLQNIKVSGIFYGLLIVLAGMVAWILIMMFTQNIAVASAFLLSMQPIGGMVMLLCIVLRIVEY